MEQTNVILVGIGGYGAQHLKEIFDNPDESINLVAVVDQFPERCIFLDEIKKRNIPIYADMDACYLKHKVDLTIIATPIFLHTEHTIKALENGSNVLCEKPLCSDAADVEKLMAAQEEAGRFVYIGYQWAYSDAIINLKQDILDGVYGALKEMRVLLLRPRPRSYFGRGVGWAGKIKAPDGKLIYDSVANNSAAHYLFNMLYVMGEHGKSAEATDICAELLRANDIENFDVCNIKFNLCGANARFIAAHPVDELIETTFEFSFEKGTVFFAAREFSEQRQNLKPSGYDEYDQIVGYMADGSKKVYGSPNVNRSYDIHVAAKAAVNKQYDNIACGIEATSAHTRLINEIQNKFSVYNIKESLLSEKDDVIYAEGLVDAAIAAYNDSQNSILSFADK